MLVSKFAKAKNLGGCVSRLNLGSAKTDQAMDHRDANPKKEPLA